LKYDGNSIGVQVSSVNRIPKPKPKVEKKPPKEEESASKEKQPASES
jgi:hypoxia up-regulated 1